MLLCLVFLVFGVFCFLFLSEFFFAFLVQHFDNQPVTVLNVIR